MREYAGEEEEMSPRINVEDCWWVDPRRSKLIRLADHDEDVADGAMLKAWRLAQEHWKNGKSLVPEQLFMALERANAIIEAGLAERREGGIYVRGSADLHERLHEKREAASAGGRTSAQRPRDELGRLLPKQEPSTLQADSSRLQRSSSSSSSKEKTKTGEGRLTPPGLLGVWNRERGVLPEAKLLTRSREGHARARLAENDDPAHWSAVVRFLATSPFHRGQNDRSWVANFDYLLRPNTHISIAEKLSSLSPEKTPDQITAEIQANMRGEG